jgi:hypothetical protein
MFCNDIKTHYDKYTYKYGIHMPISIEEAYAIDQRMEITYGIKQLLKRGKSMR